ncbi:MAG: hypothetical protein B6229_01440 [Spirochaetaceae bacterium 4572_7]|nr:MAG: hypothetical protein B6229_01440 [Spirochaetaceae bacterium 4572_7]
MEKYNNSSIQYEDNIFYLKISLINLKKASLLSINRELFQKKVKEDLLFIEKCSEILYEKLLQNNKLITRNKLLHDILTLKSLFNLTTATLISANFIKKIEFQDILNSNSSDISYISGLLDKEFDSEYKEDLITNEELNILFTDDSDKDK